MKIVQIPFCFFPDPVGGTELYVEALARELQSVGTDVVVAAPGKTTTSYNHAGLHVRRFAVTPDLRNLEEMYGEGDQYAARAFAGLLDEEQPHLVHLHAYTPAVSLRLLRVVKQRQLPVVFTYHTPTASCQRGTLMRWGAFPCDGRLKVRRCTACALHGMGLNKVFSTLASNIPPAVGRRCASARHAGGMWTALRMSELMRRRHVAFRTLMTEADAIVTLCRWTNDLLRYNGVDTRKITHCPHGLLPSCNPVASDSPPFRPPDFPLRIACFARFDPAKGLALLIRSLRQIPQAPVLLHLYGVAQGESGQCDMQHLARVAEGDVRITFFPTVSHEQILGVLRQYHVVAVPSQGFETGPLVVLESFAAGVPVLGSNLGGIAELIRHEINGLLVEAGNVAAWSRAIERCCDDRALLGQLRDHVRPLRSMQEVRREMLQLYECLVAQQGRRE